MSEINNIANAYFAAKQLINPNEPQYINTAEDDALARAVTKGNQQAPQFMRRDTVLKKIREHMQPWCELHSEASGTTRK